MGRIVFLISFLMLGVHVGNAQSVLGKWKTIDDETGEAKALVEITREQGKLFGRVIKILNKDRKDAKCIKCDGKLKDRPILGLPIIDGFTKEEDGAYKGKRLTDPTKGLTVRGKIWLDPDNENRLKVRGYLAFFYRTQTWLRVNDL